MRKRREAAVMSRKVKVMICFFILFIIAEFFVTASRTACMHYLDIRISRMYPSIDRYTQHRRLLLFDQEYSSLPGLMRDTMPLIAAGNRRGPPDSSLMLHSGLHTPSCIHTPSSSYSGPPL